MSQNSPFKRARFHRLFKIRANMSVTATHVAGGREPASPVRSVCGLLAPTAPELSSELCRPLRAAPDPSSCSCVSAAVSVGAGAV